MFSITADVDIEKEEKVLEDTIGNNEQDKKEIRKKMVELFNSNPELDKGNKNLPIKLICPRFKNHYIFNKKEVDALIKSIREEGLWNPLIVINIEDYLNKEVNPDISKEERDYYEYMQNVYGCEYFISSGHKRFRAILSNLMNTYVDSDKKIIDFYEKVKSGEIKIGLNDKRYFVDCIVGNPYSMAEDNISKGTNGLSRTLTAFEHVVNAVDSMAKEKGLTEDQVDVITASQIQEHISKKFGIDIELKTIKNNWGYARKIKDKDILELIYKGQINVGQMKILTPIYDKVVSAKEVKSALIKDAKAGHLDMNAIKEKVKPSKKKAGRTATVKISKAEVLDILNQIKMKTIKVDDAIKMIERRK